VPIACGIVLIALVAFFVVSRKRRNANQEPRRGATLSQVKSGGEIQDGASLTAKAPAPSALPVSILDVPLAAHANRKADPSGYLMLDDTVRTQNMEGDFMESAKPRSSSEQHGFDKRNEDNFCYRLND
jgi:hypothetical protein